MYDEFDAFVGRVFCLFIFWSHNSCLILHLAISFLSHVQHMCGNTVYNNANVRITIYPPSNFIAFYQWVAEYISVSNLSIKSTACFYTEMWSNTKVGIQPHSIDVLLIELGTQPTTFRLQCINSWLRSAQHQVQRISRAEASFRPESAHYPNYSFLQRYIVPEPS